MVLPKNSPFREFLNYQLLKMMETGVLKRIIRESGLKQASCDENPSKWKTPSLKKTCSMFLVLFIGMGCSLLCLIGELSRPKWLHNFHKSPKLTESAMLQELEIVTNKLLHLQATMITQGMETNATIIKSSLSILENVKLK